MFNKIPATTTTTCILKFRRIMPTTTTATTIEIVIQSKSHMYAHTYVRMYTIVVGGEKNLLYEFSNIKQQQQ